MEARIVAVAETPYSRHPAPETTTEQVLAEAFVQALAVAGIGRDEVDGLGVASFSLTPDHVADLAWRLGVRAHWLMEDTNGGAATLNMLQHARRAIEAGDARTIVLLAGDHLDRTAFADLVDNYNRATVEHLAPIPFGGPNAIFALLTQRHMAATGLERADYGRLVVHQRGWAQRNPGAVYRDPLTIEEYLAMPQIAPPLCRYDCVPVVTGANAVVLSASDRGVRIRALRGAHNIDGQLGDGLHTGIAEVADELWSEAGFGPQDVDAAYVYDDYPAMALIQLDDLGLVPGHDVVRFVRSELPAINTSGGQLSAGQAGTAGGMHGLAEAVRQLLGLAEQGRRTHARRAVVTGYGMIAYRYGACANAAVLEAP